ncbi:MAG: SCP-like extracellular [Sphingomonas sp.]|nr:SCP-like extracellular [Sphingomonas sp.]
MAWRLPLLLGTLLASPLLVGAAGLEIGFDARILAAHNRERAALGIAPLRWDQSLAADAAIWARHLAATGQFEHAPDGKGAPEGENLWAGTKGYYSAEAMVDGWAREKRYYKPGRFPDNSTTGRVADVGHYTQLMWRGTGRVGCALATGAVEDVLVCRYGDAGNYIGETPF